MEPLPLLLPMVELPWSLVARRTITTCHHHYPGFGDKGELCALTHSVPATLALHPQLLARGNQVWDVTWQIPLQFHHSLWVSPQWSHEQ